MNKYIKVDGHSGLGRSRGSGAIINLNKEEIAQARKRKKVWLEQQQEIAMLKSDMQEMKSLVKQLIEDRNGSNSN